jgi:hypothetical protein
MPTPDARLKYLPYELLVRCPPEIFTLTLRSLGYITYPLLRVANFYPEILLLISVDFKLKSTEQSTSFYSALSPLPETKSSRSCLEIPNSVTLGNLVL